MISETDKAWLAGVFDREGCIGLYPRILSGKRSGWDYFVAISNSDPLLVNRMAEIVAELTGKKAYIRTDKRRGNRRTCFAVVVYTKRYITAFLKGIRPYLVCKGPQADVMLIAMNTRGNGAGGSNPEILAWAQAELLRLKAPYDDAEVTPDGLRYQEHRNDYPLSPNNIMGTSPQLAFLMEMPEDIV